MAPATFHLSNSAFSLAFFARWLIMKLLLYFAVVVFFVIDFSSCNRLLTSLFLIFLHAIAFWLLFSWFFFMQSRWFSNCLFTLLLISNYFFARLLIFKFIFFSFIIFQNHLFLAYYFSNSSFSRLLIFKFISYSLINFQMIPLLLYWFSNS